MTGRRQSRRFTMSLPPEQQITNFLRENPLVCSILEDDTEKMENILESNPNLNVSKQDNHKQTPLHYAAFIGNEVRKQIRALFNLFSEYLRNADSPRRAN